MVDAALELGGVYLADFDTRPFRVIGFDETEVFYDCLWNDGKWIFSGSFKKKVYFYRMSATIFIKRTKKIEPKPFTSEEFKAFRPDLPLSFARTLKLKWNDFYISTYTEFAEWAKGEYDGDINESIQSDKLVLIPYGTKGGLKKGTMIYADNAQYFIIPELIWKAKEVQEPVNVEKSIGIGFYRAGFEKGVPSYFIKAYDRLY